MQTNCTVLAKVVVNKRLQTLRVLFTFDKHNKLTIKNCVLVTGDICDVADENAQYYIQKEIAKALDVLRCTSATVVE